MRLAAVAMLTLATGCMPYATGHTAATTPRGQLDFTASSYAVRPGIKYFRSDEELPEFGLDLEGRFGVNDRSDIGFRVVGFTGLTATYKYQLQARRPLVAPITSVEFGGGFLHGGDHGLLQAMLITSAREGLGAAPYGGIRLLGTAPLTTNNDSLLARQVTAGLFTGVRLREGHFAMTPELAVFYSRNPNLRNGKFIFVPSISFSGIPWDLVRGWPLPRPIPRNRRTSKPRVPGG